MKKQSVIRVLRRVLSVGLPVRTPNYKTRATISHRYKWLRKP